jgi:hypothetical protein
MESQALTRGDTWVSLCFLHVDCKMWALVLICAFGNVPPISLFTIEVARNLKLLSVSDFALL